VENSTSNPGPETMQSEIAFITWRRRLTSWYALHTVPEEPVTALVSTILGVAVWVYAGFVVLSSFAAEIYNFDDIIPLLHGMLIQQGRTPNLDFYSFYPPLGLYVNAALFTLLGRTVLATRAFAAILYLLLLFVATRFFRFRFPYSHPLVPAAMLVVATSIGSTIGSPVWPGLAVSILALLTYLFSQREAGNSLWVVGLSGFLTGVAVLYRVNFGAYVVMVVAFDLLLRWFPHGGTRQHRFRLKQDLLTAAVYVGPLAAFCATFCFSIYGKHAVTTVVDLVVHAQKYMIIRFIELPFSSELAWAVVLPAGWFFLRMLLGVEIVPAKALVPAALAITLLLMALVGRTHFSIVLIVVASEIVAVVFFHLFIHRLERPELSVLLFFCGLLHYYLSRADWYHARTLPIGGALLLPFLAFSRSGLTDSEARSSVSRGTGMAVLLAASFMCFASPGLRPPVASVRNGARLLGDLVRHPHLTDTDRVLGPIAPDASWSAVYSGRDELRALRYLRAASSNTDAIFSGVPDHSTVYLNNLRIYWLADRPIGVRTFQLETRMATEAPVQQGIIADLEQNKVKWVVIDNVPWEPDPTFAAHRYVGSKLLDQYIASHYQVEAKFGPFVVSSRKAIGQPDEEGRLPTEHPL
jgi:hypothetical protein